MRQGDLRKTLERHGIAPLSRYGQNFLIETDLCRVIVEEARIGPESHVLEIGAGVGTLTEVLVDRARSVTSVEIDTGLLGVARERLSSSDLRFLEGDVMAGKNELNRSLLAPFFEALDGAPYTLVSNLPYNIATPIIVGFLRGRVPSPERMLVMVQKEMADRLVAGPREDSYGSVSVLVGAWAEVELLRTVAPDCFYPRPAVWSRLVRLEPRATAGRPAGFEAFVREVFNRRRKQIRKILTRVRPSLDPDAILEDVGLDSRRRPDAISPVEFLALFKALGADAKG